jgi:hypothetical protein
MNKVVVYIFILLLFFSADMYAQVTDPLQDTLILIPPGEKDTTTFAVIGQPEVVAVRTVPQKRVDSLRADEDYWYANTAPERKNKAIENKGKPKKGLLREQWFRDLLWAIVLCTFIGVVLWYLHASNILIFRKKAKPIINEEEAEMTDDIFALNYDKEISKAVEAKDFRLAVRLLYLQTLKDLSDKNLIDYRYGRTNSDYVAQLGNSRYHRDFFRLTRNFEYTWYGQFSLSAEAYEMMRTDFSQFKTGLH